MAHGCGYSLGAVTTGPIAFPLIRAGMAALKVRSCLIDGEAVCCEEDGVPSFQALRRRQNDDAVFLLKEGTGPPDRDPRLCLVVTNRGQRQAAVLCRATPAADCVAGGGSAGGDRGRTSLQVKCAT
jgi:hypothetical protein